MTQAVTRILQEAQQLSPLECADLTDRLVERLMRNMPTDVEQAQLAEVRRRIAQVESGEVTLIPGGEALAQVRQLVKAGRTAN